MKTIKDVLIRIKWTLGRGVNKHYDWGTNFFLCNILRELLRTEKIDNNLYKDVNSFLKLNKPTKGKYILGKNNAVWWNKFDPSSDKEIKEVLSIKRKFLTELINKP